MRKITPELQTHTERGVLAFYRLKTKTSRMSNRLNSMYSTLSMTEDSVREASNISVVGGVISEFADLIASLKDDVKFCRKRRNLFHLFFQSRVQSFRQSSKQQKKKEMRCSMPENQEETPQQKYMQLWV